VALGQVFSEYFGFPCQFAFHRLLHNHHLSSGAGTIGQTVAAVPSGLSLIPREKKYLKRLFQLGYKLKSESALFWDADCSGKYLNDVSEEHTEFIFKLREAFSHTYTLKMQRVFFKTLVYIYQTTRRHMPKNISIFIVDAVRVTSFTSYKRF
jgi:hypothetical protein